MQAGCTFVAANHIMHHAESFPTVVALATCGLLASSLVTTICIALLLQEAGYDLGPLPEGEKALAGLGEALLKALKAQEEPRTVSKGTAGGHVLMHDGIMS
jgi:hypothetical protein